MGDFAADLKPAHQGAMRGWRKHGPDPKTVQSLPVNRGKVKTEDLQIEQAFAFKSGGANQARVAKFGCCGVNDFGPQSRTEVPAKLDRLCRGPSVGNAEIKAVRNPSQVKNTRY